MYVSTTTSSPSILLTCSLQRDDLAALKKIKATFEFKPLKETFGTTDDIPEEAIDSSAMAMNVLLSFCGNTENKRNYSK